MVLGWRVGQQIAGLGEDRLPGQIAVGVLTKVFPPSLVDEVVAAAGVGEQRIRVLPARLVVYYNLAMIVFFQSSYGQVWTKLVGGLGGAKSFRMRVAVGMSPSPAAISKARSRLGWQVMADRVDRVAGPWAGRDEGGGGRAGGRRRLGRGWEGWAGARQGAGAGYSTVRITKEPYAESVGTSERD